MNEKTITLPDGYNGHTVECYTTPLEIKDGLAKLRVVGSTYLIKFIRLDELEAFNKEQAMNYQPGLFDEGYQLPLSPDETSEERLTQLYNAANDWRYLMTLASRGLEGRAMVEHSRRTTKGDLDAWLMKRFSLSQTEARDISNYSMEQIDFRTGRPGELYWTAGRPRPTWEEYPELLEYIKQP